MRLIIIPKRQHPFPFRTRQLSSSGSMVLAPNSVLREQIVVGLIPAFYLLEFEPRFQRGVFCCLLETSLLGQPQRVAYTAGCWGVLKPQPGNPGGITLLRTRVLVVFFNPLAMPRLTSSKGQAPQHFLRWPFWPPAYTYPVKRIWHRCLSKWLTNHQAQSLIYCPTLCTNTRILKRS